MKKKSDAVSNSKRTFVPVIAKRKNRDIVVDITFVPLICNKIYNKYIEHEVKTQELSSEYNEKKNAYVKNAFKSDDGSKEAFEDFSKIFDNHINETSELLYNFVITVIQENDNPEEYSTIDWIDRNFTQDDLGDFVRLALTAPSDEVKKK